jgi:hypothetical protein
MNFFILRFLDNKANSKLKLTTPINTIGKVISVCLPMINNAASSKKCKTDINVVILKTFFNLLFFRCSCLSP